MKLVHGHFGYQSSWKTFERSLIGSSRVFSQSQCSLINAPRCLVNNSDPKKQDEQNSDARSKCDLARSGTELAVVVRNMSPFQKEEKSERTLGGIESTQPAHAKNRPNRSICSNQISGYCCSFPRRKVWQNPSLCAFAEPPKITQSKRVRRETKRGTRKTQREGRYCF
jgi:hypothetical protein